MEGDIAQHTKSELSYWMTGKVLDDSRYRRARMDSQRLLAVHDFGRNRYFDGVSFSLNRGEILGITGLLDSGRNELALALAGVSPADHGGVEIEGSNVRLSRPTDAIAAGIGYVPEDRLSEGLFLEKSIRDNIVAEVVGRLLSRFGMIDKRRSRAFADGIADELQIAAPNLDEPVQSLSGGNQQRVLIGRGLAVKPKLLILHGPTVGVDVGSKDTIYRIMQKLAVEGIGIIVISDDLPELLSNCDRVLVMRKGTVAETFDAESTSEDVLYRALVAEQPTRSLS
jgi:simple sugar transport system ATP-binding protein